MLRGLSRAEGGCFAEDGAAGRGYMSSSAQSSGGGGGGGGGVDAACGSIESAVCKLRR